MGSLAAIVPGARVRTTQGFIGRVERLESRDPPEGQQPHYLLVRSEDGQWQYRLPLMLVKRVTQATAETLVDLAIGSDELWHYQSDRQGTQAGQEAGSKEHAPPQETSESELRLPLAAEELAHHKETSVIGHLHLHKGVVTEQQTLNVPVYHEQISIEHLAPEQYTPDTSPDPNEIIIPILEERLVVQKQTVLKEYLRIRKTLIAQQQTVQDTLRREYVERTEQGDAPSAEVSSP